MAIYLDTGALVKRYTTEAGTAWVTSLLVSASAGELFTVRLIAPEMIAALERKVRTGESSRPDVERATVRFLSEWRRRYEILEVTPALAEQAMLLARQHPLRGYDAVHLAAALAADDLYQRLAGTRLTFISSDRNLLRAIAAEGGLVNDPNDHP